MTQQRIGLVTGLSNEAYHADTTAVSKSQLDLIHQSPALLQWSKEAPVDQEADKAVDLGNAFEALLLEPERFERTYAGAPKVDRRTKEGKAAWADFERECTANEKQPLSRDEWRQVHFMRDSVMAHPVARRALEAEAMVQASYYWREDYTGDALLCRCRPDWMLEHVPFVIDVKTSGQIDRFAASVEDYRYHVQHAFYVDGLAHYYDETPSFAFLVVSTSRNAGRYPVHVYELDAEDVEAGRMAYRRDLEVYAQAVRDDEWTHVEPLVRPWWARRRDQE